MRAYFVRFLRAVSAALPAPVARLVLPLARPALPPVRLALSVATALVLTLALLLAPTTAYAEPNTTIVGLANAGEQMDGQHVIVQGEVVGDIINAEPGHKWITLLDGGASISVRVKDADAQKIDQLGRYSHIGTKVEVSGVYQVDCFDHDGLADVHVSSLVVLEKGEELASPLSIRAVHIGVLLLVAGVCLLIIHWRLRERTR